ncbi:MAG: SPOR domain-containing protein [Bacteroidales bacterium]|nr:SPOR domain-containing protein [Bacteroidales bacterium]MDT8373802.1 SPOR domain-containing protein [Bacteroidales bacterium]
MARDISGYIRELLFSHDCVIIPGFGAFIGNYFPARIDRSEGMFYPPSRKVTFNRHLTGNDGLVIGHISSHLQTGYGEARDIVTEWTDELRKRIMTGNPVTLEHLGTFSLNHERTIIFDPDLSVNYLLTSYGLSAYHRHPVHGFDVRKRVLEKQHEPAVSPPSVRRLLTRAAVIIPVLVALALVPFNDHLFKGRMEESTLNPLARAELEYNREQIDAGAVAVITDSGLIGEEPAAHLITKGESGTDKNITRVTAAGQKIAAEEPSTGQPVTVETMGLQSPPAVDNSKPAAAPSETTAYSSAKPERPAVVVHEYRYLMIIGSFQGEDNALTMVDKLRKLGFDPEVASGPDGFLRVSAESFGTLEEALTALGDLKKDFPGAWVHKTR